ncbi:MAG: VWA domain-containing protein, partial [Myxococcales bacterium]|nr:VWA domain-containing protein [Myxococcales bacterium]
DGVTDLIELAAGTDALSDEDSPRTRGDFVFVVPYQEEASPKDDTLKFRTDIQFADVYILMDLSGSMSGELEGVRTALADAVETLTCEDFGTSCVGTSQCGAGQICGAGGSCIENPKTSSCIESLWTGFGAYGDPGDFENKVSLQSDPQVTIASLPLSTTSASDEALHEALECVAEPLTCDTNTCAATGVGCPGYREDAVKIVVGVTDESDRCYHGGCGGPNVMVVTDELNAVGVNFVGINSGSVDNVDVTQNLSELAEGTGTIGAGGDPLVYVGANAEVTTALVAAINGIVRDVPLRVTLSAQETQDDAGNAKPFVERLAVNVMGGDCTAVTNTEDTNADGYDDAFSAIKPGTSVCWDIRVADNMTVKPTSEPQVFRLRLVVRGNGSIVDQRTAYFLVPPEIPVLVGPG